MSDLTVEAQAPGFFGCEHEPIHAPGAIQPHGAMLAILADSQLVTHASANIGVILGRSVEELLGRPAWCAFGEATWQVLDAGLREGPGFSHTWFSLAQAGAPLHLQAHRSGRHICIDIEPVQPESWQKPNASALQAVLKSFEKATTQSELCELAVCGLKVVTGYDRVMAYRFGRHGDGEVIAEACAEPLEPYLGQRYPATDIPAQARRQYLRQRVGAIATSSYWPVPLLTNSALDDGTPLDLTNSVLRSVSPIHLEYMRNMDTAASMTIGLADGPGLWGMLVCHNTVPRIAGPELRAAADIIGQVASLLIGSLGKIEVYAQPLDRIVILRRLISRLADRVPLAEAFAAMGPDLLNLVNATGVVVRFSNTVVRFGCLPEPAMIERALAVLYSGSSGEMLAVEDLALRYPELTGCEREGSGALMLPLGKALGNVILWFRPEQVQTVIWGGNPAKHAANGNLSPRKSFKAWKEVVRGRSISWTQVDLTLAQDLRRAVDIEIARRAEAGELERSNADLEEFSYAVSHDLKAPLRAIGHLAEWIEQDVKAVASPETCENISLLQSRVIRMQKLLDGLLEYSHVGRTTSLVEDVDVAKVTSEVTSMLGLPSAFAVSFEAGASVLWTEKVAIQIVLQNLIANSVKHHDRSQGFIRVGMKLTNGLAEFRVSDDGPGIPIQFQKRIFTIFQTLKSRDDLEGSGIGLAIVKRKVETHGGQIWVESAPPARGTTIAFTWDEAAR